MHEVKDTLRASVRVGFDGRVHKSYRGHNAEERYHHEKRILKFLERRGCDCAPRVLEHDDAHLRLVMTHCGQPVANLEPERMQEVFAEVESFGVKHTDQALRNITYDSRRGRFCVIDFELAEFISETDAAPLWTTLRWSGTTDLGRRRARNDDVFRCFSVSADGFRGLPDEGAAEIEGGDVIFVVSDGMGGAKSGDLASNLIVGRLREMIPATYRMEACGIYPDRLGVLTQCLEDVHEEVNRLADRFEHMHGMGATATLAWFTQENAYFCHVGDTRLYLFRDGELEQRTDDHTRAWLMHKSGELNERQFKTHPRRNCLQQAVGAGVQFIHPQIGAISLRRGDWFLLCSDGLIGGLWKRQIARAFQSAKHPGETMRRLLQESLEADGTDNVSLAVIALA